MVQNNSNEDKPGKRGRPREYDPATALSQALGAFWGTGYAATSLDQLSAATGMNRPSLYAAFGDKHALYRSALDDYAARGFAALKASLSPDRSLGEGLRAVYASALSIYFSGDGSPRGCFLIGTGVTEAAADPELRQALGDAFRSYDGAFEDRFRLAQQRGEIAPGADVVALARLAAGFLYFLAIRSRSGEKRAVLEATADQAARLICGFCGGSEDRGRVGA